MKMCLILGGLMIMLILLLLFSLTITSSRSERCFEKMRENERSSNEYEITESKGRVNGRCHK